MAASFNDFINLYFDNPTDGRTDGTKMSLGDDGSSPLSVIVNASKNERKVVKVALRCEAGYQTDGDTTIWFQGVNADKWSVCATEEGTYGSALIIDNIIEDTNYVFYISGVATKGELPDIDLTTKLKVSTTIKKVSQ